MYGLVNQAIEDMAVQLGGAELWRTIRERAQVDVETFVSMDTYPDDLTHRLVAAASDVLDLTPAEVLEAFGKHWLLYTGRKGYGALLEMMGRNIPEFLGNLDAMHARISLSMPELRPPSFVCRRTDDTTLILEYWSERDGLAPMVTGLLKGLGELFEADITVTPTLSKTSGADHDEFVVVHPPTALTPDVALSAAPPS